MDPARVTVFLDISDISTVGYFSWSRVLYEIENKYKYKKTSYNETVVIFVHSFLNPTAKSRNWN